MARRPRQDERLQNDALEELDAPVRPEVVVLRLRRHGRRLVLPVLALFAIAIASGIWLGSFAQSWQNVLAAVGAGLALLLLVAFPLLFWSTERVSVTTRRVVLRRGVFVRYRSEVPLSRVREVRARRGIVQRMLGSGDIEIMVGSDAILVPDVPGVEVVVDALQALIERNYTESLQYSAGATGRFSGDGAAGTVQPGSGGSGSSTTSFFSQF
ncbi:PH domain-containing protein [Leucobacter sp. GX24907]